MTAWKFFLLHKDDINLLQRLKIPPVPPLKRRLWEELQTLGSCWGGLSETECDGISEDWKTFRIYTSECCQNALLSASYKTELADKEGNVRAEYPPPLLHVLMPPVYCCRWSCSFQSEKYSKLYYFSNRIFGIGTSDLSEGEATRSWSEVLLAGRKDGCR